MRNTGPSLEFSKCGKKAATTNYVFGKCHFFTNSQKVRGGGLLEECPIPIYPYTYTHSLLLHKLFYTKNLCKMLKGKLHLDLHSAKCIRTSLRYAALLRSLESMIWIIFLLGYFDIWGIFCFQYLYQNILSIRK